MIKNTRIKEFLSSTMMLMMCILFTTMTGLKIISGILSAVSSSFFAAAQILGMFFGSILPGFLCVSIWIIYTNAKKNRLNQGAVTCVKVYSIITVVLKSITYVITIVAVAVAGIAGGSVMDLFGSKGGSAVVVLLVILVLAIVIALLIFSIIGCVDACKMLNIIKENKSERRIFKTAIMKLGIILTIMSAVASFIITIISIFSQSYINYYLGQIGRSLGNFGLTFSTGGGLSIVNSILSLFNYACMAAFWIMVFMLVGKVKKAYEEAGNRSVDDINSINNSEDTEMNTVVLTGGSITCICGPNVGYTYPLDNGEEMIIGKDPRYASIVIEQSYRQVSRKHCGIKYNASNDMYLVMDYSSNGTYIKNQQKLTKGIYASAPRGSIITLANDNVQFRLD